MSKMIKMPDLKKLSKVERKASIEKAKKKYRKKLDKICSSKSIKKRAKKIAASKYSCEQCVYCDYEELNICQMPYSGNDLKYLKIDPCYEGVLKYLTQKLQEAIECADFKEDEIECDELHYDIYDLLELVYDMKKGKYDDLTMIHFLIDIIFDMYEDEYIPSQNVIQHLYKIYDLTEEMLDQWDDDEI